MNFSWPYVAGLFDGEGTIFMRCGQNGIVPVAAIYQGGKHGQGLLDSLREWLMPYGAKCFSKCAPNRSGFNKPVYVLTLRGRNPVGQFIIYALPYLNVKKTQAQDILRFIWMYDFRPGKAGDWRGEVGHSGCRGKAIVE